jgi:hypothetical protein
MGKLLLILYIGLFASVGIASPDDVPDYTLESRRCGRVDLRPSLEKNGLPKIRHRGGRNDSASFALSEALTLSLTTPERPFDSGASARSLEHAFDSRARTLFEELVAPVPSKALSAVIKTGACSEEEAPSEDIESARLARLRLIEQTMDSLDLQQFGISQLRPLGSILSSKEFARANFSPLKCKRAFQPKSRITRSKDIERIDQELDRTRLPILIFKDERFGEKLLPVVARRLSVESGLCEYLLRRYDGPPCLTSEGKNCEDGSLWISRRDVTTATTGVWGFD